MAKQPYSCYCINSKLVNVLAISASGQLAVKGLSRPAFEAARAELLLSVLVEFWLTDGAEPVPRDARADSTPGVASAYAAKAPTEQSLLDAVQVLDGVPSFHMKLHGFSEIKQAQALSAAPH